MNSAGVDGKPCNMVKEAWKEIQTWLRTTCLIHLRLDLALDPDLKCIPAAKQDDGVSCGVFVNAFARCLASGGNPLAVDDINLWRLHIGTVLMIQEQQHVCSR